jgi:integrative and conjugative element protein (TIGR02256 family)
MTPGSSGPKVWIAFQVWDAIVAESNRAFPLETGGLLMGYSEPASARTVIRESVGPGPRAVHRRTRFLPDHRYHEREVARIYADSGRIISYLGDWHSHPRGTLALSVTDRRTLGRIARTPTARAPRPIMMVLAGTPLATRTMTESFERHEQWRGRIWQLFDLPSRSAAALGWIHALECDIHMIA